MSAITPLTCADCGAPMELRTTRKFVDRSGRYRRFWGCTRWPSCKGIHGAHPDGTPLGRPGTAAEKAARVEAHRWFDSLWKDGQRTRAEAYAWLKALPGVADHIAEMDVAQCERLVAAVREQLITDLQARFAPSTVKGNR